MPLTYNNTTPAKLAGQLTGGMTTVFTNYITATGNDTTAAVQGGAISNNDNTVDSVYIVTQGTGTGTSPTITTTLQGSLDGTTWFNILNTAGAAVATGALALSGTAANNAINTIGSPAPSFPPFLRARYVLGGTTPAFTGTVSLGVIRKGK